MSRRGFDSVKFAHVRPILVIIGLVFLAFIIVYRKWTIESWSYPIFYGSDNLFGLFFTRAYSQLDLLPYLAKKVSYLNAPTGAVFDDIPLNEDLIFGITAIAQRVFGFFVGTNLVLLGTLILNAVSFYFLLTYFKIRESVAVLGALSFGLSHYFFLRGFEHLILTTAWHLPPMLLVSYWFFDEATVWSRNKKKFALFFCALSGLLFIYYTFMFLQLIGIGLVIHLVQRRWSLARWGLLMIVVCLMGHVLSQLHTVIYQIQAGANSPLLPRTLVDLELYSLKIADLFLPYKHIVPQIAGWASRHYYSLPFLIRTEPGYSYLGIIGGLSFVFVLIFPIITYLKWVKSELSALLVFVYWILIYSLSGGINFLIGVVSGVYVFRCTNRYSIFLLMISLLFSLKFFQSMLRPRWIALLLVILFFDLTGRVKGSDYQEVKSLVDSDRSFVAEIKNSLRPGSKIMQLPVADFPESVRIFEMGDYEHFRPALYSRDLSWTYGSVRGRGENDWQRELEKESPIEQLKTLKAKGFSGLYLNKKGLSDKGQKYLDALGPALVSPYGDLLFFRVN